MNDLHDESLERLTVRRMKNGAQASPARLKVDLVDCTGRQLG
ncbi:MAG: hypothetical protein VYA84_05965 [Planctomycetota bacterium]|nr:hypothetical protein [Planctomycetota bacterium]